METKAFQEFYPDDVSHCYGCGRLNKQGLQLKSYWDGDETVARITAPPQYTAIPGYAYGGFVASIIDCHGTGSAAAAMYREQEREMDSEPPLRFVTASLSVKYHKPTPMDTELEVRGEIVEVKGRKVIVKEKVFAKGQMVATGEVVAVLMPENMITK